MAKIGQQRNVPDKVIDTWYYKVKDIELDRLDYVPEDEVEAGDSSFQFTEGDAAYREVKTRVTDKLVKVEVRLLKKTKQSLEPPHPLDSVTVEVVCPELEIKLTGTDVEALRSVMWSKLDEVFKITWERYYLVNLNRTHPYEGLGTGLELCYRHVDKGTTHDGKVLMRIRRGSDGEKIELWPGTFKDKRGNVIACIQATEANTFAMEEFARRIDLLRTRLQEFLLPENIQGTLANMAGLTMLPAAAATDAEVYDAKE